MIKFRSLIPKSAEADIVWILDHPEFVLCHLQAKRLNKKRIDASCNLHLQSEALVGITIVDKKLTYVLEEICCDSFRQDVDQELLRIKSER
jgi:hypothetical protein